jgi:hypothetical protein
MKTISAQAESNRTKDNVEILLLADATFDQFGLAVLNKFWATYAKTVTNAYEDVFVRGGIDIGISRVQPQGGLSAVASFALKIRDEDDQSSVSDTHVLSNDEIILYALFIDATEVITDRIELVRGVVERDTADRNIWTLICKDGSKKTLRKFPVKFIDSIQYPRAWEPDVTFPEFFGNLNVSPFNAVGVPAALAPCRFLNRWDLTCTSSLKKKTGTVPFQWYAQAKRWAEVVTYSETADVLTVDDPARKTLIRPVRAKTTNNEATWYNAADGSTATSVAVGSGERLHAYWGGSPKIGELTAISVVVTATGDYTLTVKDDTTTKTGPTALNGTQTVALTAADFEAWDLALLNFEIDGSGANNGVIKTVELDVRFNDFLTIQDEEPQIYQAGTGFEDIATYYEDGAVVDTVNTVLRNPALQIEAILRTSDQIGLLAAQVDSTAIQAAEASRSTWYFDWALEGEKDEALLDRLAFQAGLFLFPDEGQWTVAAMDKERTPQHFFHGDYHMPVSNPGQQRSQWDYHFSVTPADASQIINEVNLRYAKHPAKETYGAAKVASGQYRLTGTCSTSTSTGELTDASATFEADKVAIGERIYIAGDLDYQVDGIVSETVLSITAVAGGAVPDMTSETYWLGPHLDGRMRLSQEAFKTINALGGTRQSSAREETGYKSEFIHDDDTAAALTEHLVEWFSQPRDRVAFPVFYDGIKVQLGDILMLEHAKLKTSKRAVAMTVLSSSMNNSTTTMNVSTGYAALFRDGDHLMVVNATTSQPEIMIVNGTPTPSTVPVTRGQLGTTAIAHDNSLDVHRLTVKWIVTGVRPMTLDRPFFEIEAEQMPNSYKPTGKVVNFETAYNLASNTQQMSAGWSTLNNARVADEEADSNISYVG